METKHTPGPWQAVEHYSDAVTVTDAAGFKHVAVENVAVLLDFKNKLGIPHWADSPKASRELSIEEQAANARLIAAAPELLDELLLLCNMLDGEQISVGIEARLYFARAAIAKAAGMTAKA